MNAVIITGSAGGIGDALVDEFKKAKYFTIGLDKEISDKADANIKVDLSILVNDEQYASSIMTDIDHLLDGRELKVLINNAAVQILGDIEEVTLVDFKKTLDVNLTAPFLLSKWFFEKLKATKGCVVNIGSIHSKLTKPKFISYATSKAALQGLTQAMAVDFGKYVRVNLIQPAAIATDMLIEGFKDNPDGLKELESYHPAGFIGKPVDIAKLAIYLASDDASFINGSVIGVDGAICVRLNDPG